MLLAFFCLLSFLAGARTTVLMQRARSHAHAVHGGKKKPAWPGHRIHTEPGRMAFKAKAFGYLSVTALCILFHLLVEPVDAPSPALLWILGSMVAFFSALLYFEVNGESPP